MDDSKIAFSSNWEIDKLITLEPITVAVGVGTTSLYTFTGDIPMFEIMASYGGRWYQPGQNGLATSPQLSIIAFATATSISVTTNKACTIRLYVWSDKIIY